MRGSQGLGQNVTGEGIILVDGIEWPDCAVHCVEAVVYWAKVGKDRYACKKKALNAK